MLKKRISKIVFILACIITLIMPYTSTVLAATLTHEDVKTELQVLIMHEGGPEASGTLTESQQQFYDTQPHGYKIGETTIYKIIAKADMEYQNVFYCLNATKSFPGVTSSGLNSLEYTNVADLKDPTDSDVKALHLSAEYSNDEPTWTSNYKALMWLVDNMYLEKETPEQKDDYLAKAFKDYDGSDIDTVKALLTDDDIDVVQQYAIWYFTNHDTDKYAKDNLQAVTLSTMLNPNEFNSYNNLNAEYAERQDMAAYLFKYLIESAQAGVSDEVTYPSMAQTTQPNLSEIEKEGYYVVGPFKVNNGTASETEYSLKLLDQNNVEIPREDYEILIEGEQNFSDKNVNEIFDKQYYVYIPESNKTITSVNLELSYTSYETKASLWINPTETEGNKVYQPVTLLTREKTPHKADKSYQIDRRTADLALRKYIVKVNNDVINRNPTVDVTGLKEETSKTAEYKHAKNPIKVSVGDTVLYEIRVYNESDIDANATVIVDALPNGLEYIEESEINQTYGWEKISEGNNRTVYSTNYLSTEDHTIKGFDKQNDDTLDSDYVQIECRISENALASAILTNIAEIENDDIDDRDSIPGNNDYIDNDYDSSNYTGDNNNQQDLTDDDYFYKGREDDDDFEKVEVEGKIFDLNLKKFITRVNNSAPNPSREPSVDVTGLKDGSSVDAKYTTKKTPVVVEKGDIVTYTIRVYNEGELAGYAEEVADYIPEGLGFLVNYITNVDNYWLIPEGSNTIKLNTIENGTKNLSIEDFNGVKSLDEVEILPGLSKITSTKLKYSSVDNKNLIDGFDKENGTKLDYKDIQVTCIVLKDDLQNNSFRNVAEITKDLDENGKDVIDRDSTPDSIDVDKYPEGTQDDDDYEDLTTEPKEFDLSLQKFITKVQDQSINDREPQVVVTTDGKIKFTVSNNAKEPLKVENGNTIIYTIRVYNEGNIAGYAKEVSDNLPEGLEFLIDNDTNKKYEWKLYDKDGNETKDLSQAVTVKTNYLSKERSEERKENNLIEPFNPNADISNNKDNLNPDYRDIQIAFKVVEQAVKGQQRVIKNIAEITDDEDENGNPVDDVDSTPGNKKDDEDDIDDEEVYVKYFDLSLQKDLTKIIITENGTTREISVSSTDGLQKVEIHRKKINSTTVKFVYNITVKNEGEIAGYATEITDYIPEGLEFIQSENSQWTPISSNVITTNALAETKLEPGQTASVQVVLKWINGENNFGSKVNVAEISEDKNDSGTPDIDSTPDNRVPTEDDIDNAEVVLSISTGTAPTYITLTTIVLVIMSVGIVLIKKYVLM